MLINKPWIRRWYGDSRMWVLKACCSFCVKTELFHLLKNKQHRCIIQASFSYFDIEYQEYKEPNNVNITFNRSWFLRLSKFCFMDRWEADCNANIHSHLSFSVLQAMCCWYWTCCLLIEDIGRWLFWFMHWWSLCSFRFRYGSFVLELVDSKRWINHTIIDCCISRKFIWKSY